MVTNLRKLKTNDSKSFWSTLKKFDKKSDSNQQINFIALNKESFVDHFKQLGYTDSNCDYNPDSESANHEIPNSDLNEPFT